MSKPNLPNRNISWEWLQRWRYPILVFVAIILVVFEVREHLGLITDSDNSFIVEIALYLSIPVIVGLFLEILIRANREKKLAFYILSERHNLSMQLTAARDWDEVVTRVLHYPASILNVSATSLLRYDPIEENYKTLRSWAAPGMADNIPVQQVMAVTCSDCAQNRPDSALRLIDCDPLLSSLQGEHLCYCLRIDYGILAVGMLHIFVPVSEKLTLEQSLLLNNTAADIAIVLNSAWQRKELQTIEIENAATNERQEIQRDLHDTLGQNLGYIHLKLDQIMSGRSGSSFTQIKPELSRLRDLANESYELVRNTLSILHKQNQHYLSDLFEAHAKMVAERAQFAIDICEEGQPVILPHNTVHQLFNAYKEALFNIEKHAHASQVKVKLKWEDANLKMKIEDDGCGFDGHNHMEGHYGLRIMGDRLTRLGGSFEVTSQPMQGTHIKFSLPLAATKSVIR